MALIEGDCPIISHNSSCGDISLVKFYSYRQLPCIPSPLSLLHYLLIFTNSLAILICLLVFSLIIYGRFWSKDMRSILGENLIFAICLKAMGEMMRTVGSLSIGEGAEMGEYMDSYIYSLSIYLSYVACVYIPYSLFFLSFCELLDYYSTDIKKKLDPIVAYKMHIFSLIALASWLPSFYFTLILSSGTNLYIQRLFDNEKEEFHIVIGLDNEGERILTRQIYKSLSYGLSFLTIIIYILKVLLHLQRKKGGSKTYLWGVFLFVVLEAVTLVNYGLLNLVHYTTISRAFYALEITNLLSMISCCLSPLLIFMRIGEFRRSAGRTVGSITGMKTKIAFVEPI